LGSRYGFDYLIKQCATVRTVIPEIVEDLTATPQIDGVPEEILYTKNINMLEHYLDKNIVLARKHASLTWGDRSFTIMASNTIEPLTIVNGGLVRARTLSEEGKE
jgi:ADP-glucose pyrophosphorylase